MIGVQLNKAIGGRGAGDIAWLPDEVANRLIASGEGTRATLPAAPFANELPSQPTQPVREAAAPSPSTKVMLPLLGENPSEQTVSASEFAAAKPGKDRQSYKTKGA